MTDPSLSLEEKNRLLEQWRFEAEALEVAAGEGMAGGEPSLLGRVLEALDDLQRAERRGSS